MNSGNHESIGQIAPFRAMTEGTKAQWIEIHKADIAFANALPDRLLGLMNTLRNDCHGFAIDRLEHGLQAATRAYRDGRDEEYVICALLHDIGASVAPANHAEFGAGILHPYVSEKNYWMLRHHEIFQGYYYNHFFDGDRNLREQFRGHPHFEYTAQFCHLYDQNSFDPSYRSMQLEEFAPMLRRLLIPR